MTETKTYKLQYYIDNELKETSLTGTEKKVLKEAKKILGVSKVKFKDNYIVPNGIDPDDYKINFEFKMKALNNTMLNILYKR